MQTCMLCLFLDKRLKTISRYFWSVGSVYYVLCTLYIHRFLPKRFWLFSAAGTLKFRKRARGVFKMGWRRRQNVRIRVKVIEFSRREYWDKNWESVLDLLSMILATLCWPKVNWPKVSWSTFKLENKTIWSNNIWAKKQTSISWVILDTFW